MPNCNFNIVALQLIIEIKLQHECSPVNLLYIFKTPFYKNTYEELLLSNQHEYPSPPPFIRKNLQGT